MLFVAAFEVQRSRLLDAAASRIGGLLKGAGDGLMEITAEEYSREGADQKLFFALTAAALVTAVVGAADALLHLHPLSDGGAAAWGAGSAVAAGVAAGLPLGALRLAHWADGGRPRLEAWRDLQASQVGCGSVKLLPSPACLCQLSWSPG
jgi:hypothetical protein